MRHPLKSVWLARHLSVYLMITIFGSTTLSFTDAPGMAGDFKNESSAITPFVNEADSLALVAFFIGTDGAKWTTKTNWLTGPVESWHGVTVTDGRVTKLELPENNLRFTDPRPDPSQIPPAIGDLTALEVLDLQSNSLNADIPAEIGNLVNLKVLNLKLNAIGGPIPPEIGLLVQLEKLDLSANQLGGDLPSEIVNLIQLRELNLQTNGQLTGVIPDGITNMLHLEQLNLSDNSFRQLPDLSPLDPISGNGVLSTVKIENNFFDFGDIEPNINRSFSFTYTPQEVGASYTAQVGDDGSVEYIRDDPFVYEGDNLTLRFKIGGMYNMYQWFKDGVAIEGASTNAYEIGPVTREADGTYELIINNTLVQDLTLRIYPIEVKYTEAYTAQWLDIGTYHHAYSESGARHWGAETPAGMEYPAILRHSGQTVANAFWIGIKDWKDPNGKHYPYYVANLGPNEAGAFHTYPIQNKLIGRYEDTVVEVNGELSFDKEAILEEVDPGLPADRMVHNVHNMSMGISVDRKMYAYTNEYHDNYHLIEYTYCNTGNTDDDEEIELPDQTLHDVIFYRINRWRGSEQAANVPGSAQMWGRYTLHDVVGDGHEEYPVDFTAQYAWKGWTIGGLSPTASDLGSPLFSDAHETVAPGDSIGRLSGATMMGQSVIHADRSASDASYDRGQPAYMGWIWNDSYIYHGRDPEVGFTKKASHEDLYELGIVGSALLSDTDANCTDCGRAYPHFADRSQPNGLFWDPSQREINLTGGTAGGYSVTTGYGPYEMGPGECVNITVSEGIAGLSFDAATKIGQTFKRGGNDRNTDTIAYDANRDGTIDATPFDYDNVFVGTEAQTKDQWVMSARDSLFQTFYRARDLYAASNNMSVYPIVEPPRAPTRFSLWGRTDGIHLEWTSAQDAPEILQWELFRTEHWEDNLYVNGCLEDTAIPCGYERVATLPAQTNTYVDINVEAGVDYFYYIQGIGEPQPDDNKAISGTPGGAALRSSRYLTQTYTPVSLQTTTGIDDVVLPDHLRLEGNYPNPFTRETKIRYVLPIGTNVELAVYDVLGRKVRVLADEYQPAGTHEYVFDGSRLASGFYIYVLRAGSHKAEGKMLLAR